jgi:hypothetical protein
MHQANSAQRGAFSLKKLLIGLGIIAGLAGPVQAAGTIPFSLSQQFDSLGKPLANCFFYTYQAGTTSTPQNAYQDAALTTAQPNPMRCDAAGRLPQFFLADGLIKVRITDKNGIPQNYPNGAGAIDNIQVIGPSGGGGGGGTIDPTTIISTGDLKVRYGTGVLTGFVRANGRTIGSATSGATERANADCQTLFQYLWDTDANLAVSGGRGASSAADWAANKTIVTPDWRGRALAFLDDMGNAAAGRLTSTYFGTSPIVLGAASTFLESRTLLTANLPPYTPAGSVTVTSSTADFMRSTTGLTDNYASIGGACCFINQVRGGVVSTGSVIGTAQGGTSTPLSAIPPTMLATVYIKI